MRGGRTAIYSAWMSTLSSWEYVVDTGFCKPHSTCRFGLVGVHDQAQRFAVSVSQYLL